MVLREEFANCFGKPAEVVEAPTGLSADKKLGCMPVVDPDGRVIGIVTVTDLLKLFLKTLRA